MNRIVPVGTTGQATSLRVQSLRASARKVVKQIEAPRSPDPIMRRPCADREEKRVTYGGDERDDEADQEQLDLDNPNQRRLLDRRVRVGIGSGRTLSAAPRFQGDPMRSSWSLGLRIDSSTWISLNPRSDEEER